MMRTLVAHAFHSNATNYLFRDVLISILDMMRVMDDSINQIYDSKSSLHSNLSMLEDRMEIFNTTLHSMDINLSNHSESFKVMFSILADFEENSRTRSHYLDTTLEELIRISNDSNNAIQILKEDGTARDHNLEQVNIRITGVKNDTNVMMSKIDSLANTLTHAIGNFTTRLEQLERSGQSTRIELTIAKFGTDLNSLNSTILYIVSLLENLPSRRVDSNLTKSCSTDFDRGTDSPALPPMMTMIINIGVLLINNVVVVIVMYIIINRSNTRMLNNLIYESGTSNESTVDNNDLDDNDNEVLEYEVMPRKHSTGSVAKKMNITYDTSSDLYAIPHTLRHATAKEITGPDDGLEQ